ncbi:MAG: hypothetical protein NVSMB13_20420 [Mycobacteriales bacterium]
MSHPTRSARATGAAVLLLTGATLLSACGAGQRAETTQEFTTITPANAESADRTISVRAARVEVAGATTRGYLVIVNGGGVPDTLTGVTSQEASSVTITREANFATTSVGSLPIPVGGRVDLSPEASYLVLSGLKAPLRASGVVHLTLSFATAGSVSLAVPVQQRGGAVIAPSASSS